jgi:CDP-4-dehydro-6-deoxyglucose reductase, E1
LSWKLQSDVINTTYRKKISEFVLNTRRFTQGEAILEFEKNFSNWMGAEYSLFVSSGSTANFLLIDSMKEKYNWNDMSEIIVPAVTWTTNVSPIIQLGMKPVFCDINLDDMSFDYNMLATLISKNTKAIFLTHLIGLPANIEKINKIIDNNDIKIIEDCCEAQGATISNKKVGSFGIGSTFSFYWGHIMTSIEGGMVVTNDKELYHLMKMKRSHGLARELPKSEWSNIKKYNKNIDFNFLFLNLGYNFRNTEINAFIGNLQLSEVEQIINERKKNYSAFMEIISKVGCIKKVYKLGMSPFCLPLIFESVAKKEIAMKLLTESEIEYRPLISGNLLYHPAFKRFANKLNYKNANFLHNNALYIGNHQFVTTNNFTKLSEVLTEVCQ